VLQRVAACCSASHYVAVCCSVLQCVALCCSALQCNQSICAESERLAAFDLPVCDMTHKYVLTYAHV